MKKTQGVILRSVKYGESSLILDLYSLDEGRQSFIISGVRSKKKNRSSVFQLMQWIDLVYYPAKGDQLRRIKEANIVKPYKRILSDVSLTAIATLITDFLRQSVREGEANPQLYNFLFGQYYLLDEQVDIPANFHIHFLFSLSGFIGILPQITEYDRGKLFNIQEAAYVKDTGEWNPYLLDERLSEIWYRFLSQIEKGAMEIKIDRKLRMAILEALSKYYGYHLENFNNPKSLEIFKVIFA